MSKTDSGTTIDCFVRPSVVGEVVDDTVETLHDYKTEEKIKTVNVGTWPDKIIVSEQTADDSTIDRYEQFQEWAASNNCSLNPAFSLSDRRTFVTEEVDTVLTLPVLCLAIRVDGELVCVAPHTTDTGVYTISDALSDIRSGDLVHSSVLTNSQHSR